MSIFLNTTGNPTLGVGICDRCRKKFPIGELTPDRDNPGLLVCQKDNDELDRYKLPARAPESVTLRKIRPDVDISTASASTGGGGSTSGPPPGAFTFVWSEEFDAPLDPTVWNKNWLGVTGTITKPVNSNELAAYDPAQVSVEDSCLVLTAIYSPVVAANGQSYDYRSGCIESYKGSQKAGKEFLPGHYIEFKVMMEGAGKVMNNWGAVWLNGHHGSWPDHGEIDVMENLSDGPAWHYHAPGVNNGADGPASDYSGWHTYACYYQSGRIDFYYDGELVGSQTSGVLSYPMYLVLNYAISSVHGGPTVIPGKMYVDYVRVWQAA